MKMNSKKKHLIKAILSYKDGLVRYLIVEIIVMSIYLLIDVINPYLYKLLVDRVLINKGIAHLWPICFMMLFTFSSKYLIRLIQKSEEIKYEYKVKKQVRNHILKVFITKPNQTTSGKSLNIYDKYVEIFAISLKKYYLGLLFNYITVGVMVSITIQISWKLFLFSVLAIFISFIMNKLYEKKIEKSAINEKMVTNQNEGWFISILQNSVNLKGLNALNGIAERSLKRDRKVFDIYKKEHNHLYVLEIIQDFNFRFVMEMSLYFFGGYLILKNQLFLGTFLSFLSYLKKMFNNIRQIEKKNVEFGKDKVFVEEVLNMLNTEVDMKNDEKTQNGKIILQNIRYQYTELDDFCLNVDDLEINSGDKIALVGKSGCGKTTLAKILTKEIKINSGCILLVNDGETNTSSNTYCKVLHVEKEPRFFNLSVADNLRIINPQLKNEEISEVLHTLFNDEEIHKMELLSDKVLGENANRLSGGQKERLNIARVMLYKPDLIIWDEATSQLNSELEIEVYRKLNKIFSDAIQIFIVHKKEVFPYTDKTIHIENGCIQTVSPSKQYLRSKEYKTLFGV